jgi:hypothetical protein
MSRTLGSSPWLSAAGIFGVALLLSGSYCSWRGYYVPSSLRGSSTLITIGPVGAFASVYVNGTEFADGSATFTIDGATANEAELKVGQVATVSGKPGSGSAATATSIAVRTKLVGPVSAVDLPGATVTVLGQTVQIPGDISVGAGVAPNDVGGLALGDLVAVDGYRTSTGLIASRFDLAQHGQPLTVSGPVANLNGALLTFTVGGTTVDYSAVSGGLPATLANGSYVIVNGTATSDAALSASLITAPSEAPAGQGGATASLHGAVTRFGSASDFDVGGQTVATTATTTFSGGTSGSIAADLEVEVAGQYAASGAVTATSVAIVPAANVRIVGAVTALDLSAQTVTVDGITVGTTAETRWDDRSAASLRTFGLATLNVGDWIVARGVEAAGAAATARVLERWPTPSPTLVELQDLASAVSNPTFTLCGVSVSARGATFRDANGVSLTAASFFAAADGRLVRAVGALSTTGTLLATTVALRN